MYLYICDRCGKQLDRFVKTTKYDVERNAEEYGRGEDRELRIRSHDPKAFLREKLSLCDDCQKIFDDFIDRELSAFPASVTLSTER